MPLQATSGAASYDAFGGGVPVVPAYIEDVFSTYLYAGNGSTQTITNGIDLAGKGGLVWVKSRSLVTNHGLVDTVRGRSSYLFSDDTAAAQTSPANTDISSFNSNGFSIGTNYNINVNNNGATFASWTFRKQPKFFDVVTYTGNGSGRTISHNLGSTPGCILIKRTDASAEWRVFHRSLNDQYLVLNSTAARVDMSGATLIRCTSTTFDVGEDAALCASGGTYVAYLFAHDAGGFGLTGTDNVISCGSYTGNGAALGPAVNLGYEPQWILVKRATGGTSNWYMIDNMRGFVVNSQDTYATAFLYSNTYDPEGTNRLFNVTSTGFQAADSDPAWNNSGDTYIYIAIRRGPMKVPTSGTSVFAPLARTGTGTNPTVVTTGNNPDLLMSFPRTANPAAYGTVFFDKLRGVSKLLQSANTNVEATTSGTFCLQSFLNTGFQTGADFVEGYLNYSGATYAQYAMTRAPSFFDEVCYTGNDTDMTLNHNLGVVPELLIVKRRSITGLWFVYSSGTTTPNNYYLRLETTGAQANAGSQVWNNTATTFLAKTGLGISAAGQTYVAYLFATCAGVSKCTSFTGTGTLQTIDCGFTSGSRFVLIKRTDSTGDWYVWDSSRGLSSSTDPYLLLNSTAAEVTSTNWVDTTSTGFQVTAASGNNVNINGASYIALAIA